MRYPTWQHMFISTADRTSLERVAAHHLGPELDKAVTEGVVTGYHFLRKDGGLRLRYCPTEPRAWTVVAGLIAQLVAAGHLTEWTPGIYEPETTAFGGVAAMEAGHELFCRDSRHILGYLSAQYEDRTVVTRPGARLLGRRECAILLATAMMRAGGLDLYEQGDVWARVAALRPGWNELPSGRSAGLKEKINQLITVDTGPRSALTAGGPLVWAADWFGAFENAGRTLTHLARDGVLERGQRAVIAHHLIFHFNRLGLSGRDQAVIAQLATELIMNSNPSTTPNAPTSGAVSQNTTSTRAATLGQMDTATLRAATDEHAAELRASLTTKLREQGTIRSQQVANAFLETPRHLFVPGTPLAETYADNVVHTKYDKDGVAISALSQPSIVALMLEQLDVRSGQRVLELGAGTGYNAALLGYLTGPTGEVFTIDVDEDLVDGANEHLRAAGVTNVEAILSDGALGHPGGAPYDRITLTVGAGDVPTALLDQLAAGGRLLIPLRLRGGISRSIAFEHGPDGFWHSKSIEMCTFMPLRGIADDARTVIALTDDGQVAVHTHREQSADPAALGRALDYPPAEAFTGVTFGAGESFEQLDLYLACVLPGGLSRMPATGPAVESGRLRPQFGWGAMATVETDTIAYLALNKKAGGNGAARWAVGVIGHGSRGAELAATVADHIRIWDDDYRSASPVIRLAQGEARTALASHFIIEKPDSRIAVDWN